MSIERSRNDTNTLCFDTYPTRTRRKRAWPVVRLADSTLAPTRWSHVQPVASGEDLCFETALRAAYAACEDNGVEPPGPRKMIRLVRSWVKTRRHDEGFDVWLHRDPTALTAVRRHMKAGGPGAAA